MEHFELREFDIDVYSHNSEGYKVSYSLEEIMDPEDEHSVSKMVEKARVVSKAEGDSFCLTILNRSTGRAVSANFSDENINDLEAVNIDWGAKLINICLEQFETEEEKSES